MGGLEQEEQAESGSLLYLIEIVVDLFQVLKTADFYNEDKLEEEIKSTILNF